MIRNVIFDLDGTLLDTSEGIVESVCYTAEAMGFERLPNETLLRFVGPPIQKSFIDYYGCNKEEAQKAANIFRDYYKEKALLKAFPYDGIFKLCRNLINKDYRLAIATYKREDYALKLLKHFGFDDYCDPIHGADNNNILTKKDIVTLCMNEMGADCHDSVLIGDTVNDAIGAETASIAFIAVTYGFGFHSQEEIQKYPHIGVASNPIEISDIITRR